MYLRRWADARYLLTALPCLVMLVVTNWAMIDSLQSFYSTGNTLLLGVSGCITLVALWMTVETALVFRRSFSRRAVGGEQPILTILP